MSSFRALIERVRVETLARSRRPFDEAKRHQPALAPHATLSALLTTMGDEREATYPEREAITRALMEEHRRTCDGRWASVLVLAYFPMLSRLRHRLVSSSVARDELDQIVLTSFVTSVAEVPLELDRMPMRLRQRTERQVFGFLRKEWAEYHPGAEPDQLAIYGTESIVQRRIEETDELLLDLSLLLDRAVAQGIPESSLEVIEATVLKRELLREYVTRLVPNDAEEWERTYQRLKRQRSRAMERLRALLVSPVAEAAGF